MKLAVVTPPAEMPITLVEAKAHCRVDIDDDDTLINRCIAAAVDMVEKASGRALVTQTLRMSLDSFPWDNERCAHDPVRLPRPPLQSIESFEYTDSTGATQVLAPEDYQLDVDAAPGELHPAVGESWPSTQSGKINAVRITYVAGYGDAEDVPAGLKQAVLLLVGHWYENRETVAVGTISKELEQAFGSLVGSFWHGWSFGG
ncbi:MAG TPA: head-tail connector protein [Phycisphaerales bacterium]|nr:head-tail connector protein [Phycisphaerales bacterium]